jgi:integrase
MMGASVTIQQAETTMSIRKREWMTTKGELRSRWVADYADQQGTRHAKMFARKKDADAWLGQTRYEVKQGIHTPTSTSITISEAGELWISQAKADRLEESTVRQYRQHLDHHIKPYLGNVTLAKLTPGAIPDFRNRLAADGRSPAMVRKVFVSLGALLGTAMDHGKVARNVVHDQPKKRQRRTEKRHRSQVKAGVDFPTMAEIRTLLLTATEKGPLGRRAFLQTAVFTGMRASELRGLTWDDVDLRAGTVAVRQRANLWGAIGSPKSQSARRTIPIPPDVVSTLKEWKLACPKGELKLVFPNGKGNVENHANITTRVLDPLQTAAGVVDRDGNPKYGLHALRHFYASMVIKQFPPKKAQELLGHSSITMTFDTYGHLFPDQEGDQAKVAAIAAAVFAC